MHVKKWILLFAILLPLSVFATTPSSKTTKSDAKIKQAQTKNNTKAKEPAKPANASNSNQAANDEPVIKPEAPLFKNLGTHTEHSIATNIPLAQTFFNQGLILYYGFEWSESIRSFREATRIDPDCAMCWWGLALALGSKANAPMTGHEYKDAKEAIEKAITLSKSGPVSETAYTNALALRFQHEPKPIQINRFSCCHMTGAQLDASSHKELEDYAAAMQKFIQRFPDDNDAKALYAFALFDTIDWKFWNADGKINPVTPTVISTLDAILANSKKNIGGNHYYIHVMEQSPQPAVALTNADRLKTLVPDSEHLVHMPTHIYFLTGRYHEASNANQQAIDAYKNYSKTCVAQGYQPEITYLYHHDFDFLRTTATMEGRKQLALSAAAELIANLPASWMEQNADLQGFFAIPYFVKARFGLWEDLLKEPQPNEKYTYAVGMWHYAQGMALARTGEIKKAEEHIAQLGKIFQRGPSPEALGKFGNNLLTIAYEVLAATLSDANGNEKATFNHLNAALKIQHDMGYHEPPDWYFPIRQALGDAYLKWKHPIDAINMYDQVLRAYPKNGWSLYGISQALRQMNQPEKAKRMDAEFKKAWQYADIKEPVSLFPEKQNSQQ